MKAWIDFSKEKYGSPLTCWIYSQRALHEQDLPAPDPLPPPLMGKGYPVFCVQTNSFTFEFASLYEIKYCADVLAQKNLPTFHYVHEDGRRIEPPSTAMPNRHWLSRLPGWIKDGKTREKIVKDLRKSIEVLKKEWKKVQ